MDIGCGPGITSLYLAGFYRQVVAVDTCPVAVDHLRRQAAELLHTSWPGYSCHNGCFIAAPLQEICYRLQYRQLSHDFGQPRKDLNEAASFIRRMLKIPEEYTGNIPYLARRFLKKRA